MDLFLGLDAGTTATKVVAATSAGAVRAAAGVAYPLLVPGPGRAELDPRRLTDAAVGCLADVAGQVRAQGHRVVGVALSAAMHGLVELDRAGSAAGPVLTWADASAAPAAARLHAEGVAGRLHRRTGTPVHAMSPMVKLAWRGAEARTAARWGGVKELLLGRLCGRTDVLDLSCATTTGLYDLHLGRWDPEAMAVAGVRPEQLAQVVPGTTVLQLAPDAARATGLDPATPVVVGAADGPLATLGTGVLEGTTAACSVGTSGALRAVRSTPAVDAEGQLFCYALTADRWVVGGAVNNAGSVLTWAAQALSGRTGATEQAVVGELLAEAARVPAGSDGLVCLPYLLGERAPLWRSDLTGAYLGLRRDHGRGHLVRAALEGVGQQLALVRDALPGVGVQVTQVRATGGAVASALWVQVLADALDLPVRVGGPAEGTAVGACLLGWSALAGLDLEEAAAALPAGPAVQPDPSAARLLHRRRAGVRRAALAVADLLQE